MIQGDFSVLSVQEKKRVTVGAPGVYHPGPFYPPQFMVWAYLQGWGGGAYENQVGHGVGEGG